MKAARLSALVMLLAGCINPVPPTATIETSATHNVAVGGLAQLVVKLTNTGPAIPHLRLVFMTTDKCYDLHTVTDFAVFITVTCVSSFDSRDPAAAASSSFSTRSITP